MASNYEDSTTLSDLSPTWRFAGSHEKPRLLWEVLDDEDSLLGSKLKDPALFRSAVADAYQGRNINMGGDLHGRQWLTLFRRAGYLSDGPEMPEKSLVVYRGCIDGKVRAPAWTTDQDTAFWFANRVPEISMVWKTTVEPRHVLARFESLDEYEVVVSPYAPALRDKSLTIASSDPDAFDAGAARVRGRRPDPTTRLYSSKPTSGSGG